MAPLFSKPSIIEWIAAIASLLYVFPITNHLNQPRCAYFGIHLIIREAENELCGLSERLLFIPVQVRAITFGKSESKYRAVSVPKKHQRPVTARLSSARPRNTLLYQPAAEIGIDKSLLGSPNRLAQHAVGNILLAGELIKPRIREDPHLALQL
jgi:hypothetical protein